MNLLLDGVLDGGINNALNLDTHGKGLFFRLLDMMVSVDAIMAAELPDITDDTFVLP